MLIFQSNHVFEEDQNTSYGIDILVVFNLKFITHDVILMEVVIVGIDDTESSILCRNFERIKQVPTWPSEVIRCTVKDEPVRCPVELVVPTTNALVITNQQILMLIDHA